MAPLPSKRIAAAGAGSRTLSVLCFRQHSPQQKQAAASLCGVGVRRRQQRIQKQARQECMVSTSQPGQPRKLRQLPRSRRLRHAKSKGGGGRYRSSRTARCALRVLRLYKSVVCCVCVCVSRCCCGAQVVVYKRPAGVAGAGPGARETPPSQKAASRQPPAAGRVCCEIQCVSPLSRSHLNTTPKWWSQITGPPSCRRRWCGAVILSRASHQIISSRRHCRSAAASKLPLAPCGRDQQQPGQLL